ncbi:MAG: tRNA dihydrouridine synthase DusB [Thermodesulfobacteriota bacterium]|nr:tRNA dihydrouridine synthase DusB [Thermodesulfobacteriota bacterium]
MLHIGALKLDNWLVMAPMAGITNLAFRLLVKRLGAGLVTTEMVSAMGLTLGKRNSFEYLKSHPDDRPLAVQIFGSKPDVMARAAQIAVESGANLVDINMGCPVKKVVKTGAGASLLRYPKKVAEIISSVRLACPVPLTIKIRAGWSPDQPVACEIAQIIEDCGADAVTVHPRFASSGFSGQADWSLIGRVKKRLKIPVIGNGDVFKPSQALEMKIRTGCDGVMIGRGAMGNPWIFKQILQLNQGLAVSEPDLNERRSFIIDHYQLLTDSMGEHRAALAMRGLLLRYTKGLPYSSQFRGSITKIRDLGSLISTMDNYFSILKDGET